MLKEIKEFKLAETYRNEGKLELAIKYYCKTLQSVDRSEVTDLAIIYQVIGVCYSSLQNTKKAEEYLEKSLELARSIKDYFLQANIMRDISMVYTNVDNYAKAKPILKKALATLQKISDKKSPVYLATLGITKSRYASTISNLGEYSKAKILFKESDKTLAISGHLYWRITNLTSFMRDAYDNKDSKALIYTNTLLHYIIDNSLTTTDSKLLLKLFIIDLYLCTQGENSDRENRTLECLKNINVELKKMEENVRNITFNRFKLNEIILMITDTKDSNIKKELFKLDSLLNENNLRYRINGSYKVR